MSSQSAWDNYIANNNAMDPANSVWPMNLDFDSMGTPGASQSNPSTVNTASTGVFMGAATPNTGGM